MAPHRENRGAWPHLEIDMVHFWYRKTFSGHEQVMLCTKNVSKGRQGGREGWDGKCLQTHHCQRLHFQLKMDNKPFGDRARPDPLGELKRSPRSPIRSGAREGPRGHSLAAVRGSLRRKGKWKCMEWAEMNERRYLKTRHRQGFQIQVICMLGADLRKEPIERA